MKHIIFINDLNAECIQDCLCQVAIHFLRMISGDQTHLLRKVIVEIRQGSP